MFVHENFGFDPETMFGKEAETRIGLVDRITREKLWFAYSPKNEGESQYYDAARNILASHLMKGLTLEEEVQVQEGLIMDRRQLRTYLGRITARLFLPYISLQEEIGLNILNMQAGAPHQRETIPLIHESIEELKAYYESMDAFVERLHTITQRRGMRYAMRRSVRDGLTRSLFDGAEEYGTAMMKGIIHVMTLSYIQPSRIVKKLSETPLSGKLKGSVISVLAEQGPMLDRILTDLGIEFNKAYAIHEMRRIWKDS